MTKTSAEGFLNREWSWLAFNERVLEEAGEASGNPLLERVRFLAIVASNLDEYFMVRVAGLKRQRDAGDRVTVADGHAPSAQLSGIEERVRAMVARQSREVVRILTRELPAQRVHLDDAAALQGPAARFVDRWVARDVFPVLTPMAVDPTHPFPLLVSGRLYLLVRLAPSPERALPAVPLAFVEIPGSLPRFVRLPGEKGEHRFCTLEGAVARSLASLFAGSRILGVHPVRVTRDADLPVDEDEGIDLMKTLQDELLLRRRGDAVRLEYDAGLGKELVDALRAQFELADGDLFPVSGLMQLRDLHGLVDAVSRPDLSFPAVAALAPRVQGRGDDVFDTIRAGDVFLYHPYHAFDPVTDLVERAADDPAVLAIKQTLYRTSGDSPIVAALARAAEAGTQVTALVELRARFDEARNIEWAKRLEASGVHVIYGVVGYKTHCKALLVVRREREGIRRYVHLSTGNYNDRTARVYTDMGLMTCDDALAADVSELFNVITGYAEPPRWRKLEMAPTGMRSRFVALIEREAQSSTAGRAARIVAKMNSLVDREIIEALYRASARGVQVDLIVRGICCLRPGVPGLSENIRVRSIVGRYLEHARVFWFENGGDGELFLSSADWMPRNLDSRVEILFPVESGPARETIRAIMDLQLRDTVKARILRSDGTYVRARGGKAVDSQAAVHELLAQRPRRRSPAARTFTPRSAPEKGRRGR